MLSALSNYDSNKSAKNGRGQQVTRFSTFTTTSPTTKNNFLPEMTRDEIKKTAVENGGYETPELNDELHLHYKGYRKIENLTAYVQLKALWLDSNGFQKIENLNHLSMLKCLFLQRNLLTTIENLDGLTSLVQLDLSENRITKVENLSCLPCLSTLNLAKNALTSSDSIRHLSECAPSLTVVDLSHNELRGGRAVIDVLSAVGTIVALNVVGNPMIAETSHFRKKCVAALATTLRYLDRPVFDDERASTVAWMVGGREAELKTKKEWREKKRREEKKSMEDFRNWQAEIRRKKQEELRRIAECGPTKEEREEMERLEREKREREEAARIESQLEREKYALKDDDPSSIVASETAETQINTTKMTISGPDDRNTNVSTHTPDRNTRQYVKESSLLYPPPPPTSSTIPHKNDDGVLLERHDESNIANGTNKVTAAVKTTMTIDKCHSLPPKPQSPKDTMLKKQEDDRQHMNKSIVKNSPETNNSSMINDIDNNGCNHDSDDLQKVTNNTTVSKNKHGRLTTTTTTTKLQTPNDDNNNNSKPPPNSTSQNNDDDNEIRERVRQSLAIYREQKKNKNMSDSRSILPPSPTMAHDNDNRHSCTSSESVNVANHYPAGNDAPLTTPPSTSTTVVATSQQQQQTTTTTSNHEWTKDMDDRLTVHVRSYSFDFASIARQMQTGFPLFGSSDNEKSQLTPNDCRLRWCHLDEKLWPRLSENDDDTANNNHDDDDYKYNPLVVAMVSSSSSSSHPRMNMLRNNGKRFTFEELNRKRSDIVRPPLNLPGIDDDDDKWYDDAKGGDSAFVDDGEPSSPVLRLRHRDDIWSAICKKRNWDV